MYKVVSNPAHDEFLFNRLILLQDQHSYSTRNNNQIVIPRFKKEKSRRSNLYNGITIWNSLLDNIKTLPYNSFKWQLKQDLSTLQSVS